MSCSVGKKRYFSLEELAKKHSVSSSDLIHFGAHNGLPIYVLADSWRVMPLVRNPFDDEWMNASPAPISVSGPFRLFPDTLLRLEANPSAIVTEVGSNPVAEHEPDEECRYRLVGRVSLEGCNLVLMTADCKSSVERYVSELGDQEQPIKNKREKDTLYKIMLALAKEAGFNFSEHPTKYATALAEGSQFSAEAVSARAIESHFKEALKLVKK